MELGFEWGYDFTEGVRGKHFVPCNLELRSECNHDGDIIIFSKYASGGTDPRGVGPGRR